MLRKYNTVVFFFFIFALVISSAYGQTDPQELDDYIFKLAVFGPSEDIFVWWGHAALIVEDTRWNYSRAFDWGIFYYPSDNFLKDFIKEQVRYRVTAGYFNIREYTDEDRDITIYTLDLDRAAKERMISYAQNIVLPENCYYDYHEFHDNCATGVRDIIDLGIQGQLKASFGDAPGRFTKREHVLRFSWSRPFSDWFLGFLMGQDLDRQITVWEEMFLPVEIARNIADFTYTDDSGDSRNLVSSVQVINSSKNRPPVLNTPLITWPFFLAAGLLAASVIFLIRAGCAKNIRLCREVLGLIHVLMGLFLGLSGCVLAFGLFFMSNDYIQQNINILFVNPLLLIIAPLGILSAMNKSFFVNPNKILSILWTYVFVAGNLSVFARALPFFYQQNQSVQALIIPVAFAL
ncbi:MAG: DUF4105 domain-containing protein, partial [Treponema sp.]|nr:DUF4105 domain-containing protein [Treponema sp.]